MINFLFAVLMATFMQSTANIPETSWEKATNWKLYQIGTRAAFKCPVDSLQNYKSIKLDDKEMKVFMQKVIPLANNNDYAWMGAYVVTCQFKEARTRKVLISNYGGFFFDDSSKRYYRIKSDLTDKWLNFLNESLKMIN